MREILTLPRIEKALLVGVSFPRDQFSLALSLAELGRLTATAGALVVGQLTQNRDRPDPRTFIGSGKITELQALVSSTAADLVIFDHELSPAQERNLADDLGVKVIDRTELILDIFAQHARSREGKLQVELAQATFLLTRLSGHGAAMSRLGGGIGTRGPGETKLEYDRRRLRQKISQLKAAIEKVRQERQLKREKRHASQIPAAVLVGYTNAGKSTLLNALTQAGVLTADKLFATLDPTVRRLYLPSGRTILISDTVGFIQKLPHSLVAAFRATLEEVTEADLLIHVVDLSSDYYEQQITAVYQVLEDLGGIAKPLVTVFNKCDRLSGPVPKKTLSKYKPAVAVSALQATDLDKLLTTVDALLPGLRRAN
ncbi:MAG: GTPase HflX [Candidatus Margulisbacteria bacterium]|jgi:GTP-binding protein HflX|nr:GTPase HflX [Candidatus Margulisiibacteriota bacterium]